MAFHSLIGGAVIGLACRWLGLGLTPEVITCVLWAVIVYGHFDCPKVRP